MAATPLRVEILRRVGGPLPADARVLEIGCGSGYGTRLLFEQFGAAHVDAVDLDPAMIRRARKRLAAYNGRYRAEVGSATDLEHALGASAVEYDAVFDFAIIHHVPDWRAAVSEVSRVLRPGGRFYFDEVTSHALERPIYKLLFDHPKDDRFSADQFLEELPKHGLEPLGAMTRIRGDYLLGAAMKVASTGSRDTPHGKAGLREEP